jgi:hypothetical protein
MKAMIREAAFYVISAAIILPAPILLRCWMVGETITQSLYR